MRDVIISVAGRWWYPHKWFWVILAGVVLLRIPNLYEPYWYGDEGIYLTVGQALSRGDRLYAEIMDHKTPLIYWMAALAYTLYRFKLLLLVSSLISTCLFYALTRRLIEGKVSQLLTTLLFALAITLPRYEGNIVNGELVLMPFVLGAFYVFWRGFPSSSQKLPVLTKYFRQTHWSVPVSIGALYGMAVLTKVPSGFDLAALGVFLALLPHIWSRKLYTSVLRYAGLIGAGFGAILAASMIWFLIRGTLSAYIDFGLLYNFRYIESWGSPFENRLAQLAASSVGRIGILGGFILAVRFLVPTKQMALRWALIWLGMSLFAATLSLRPYPHYFIQVMPAAILTLGLVLQVPKRMAVFGVASVLFTVLVVDQLHTRPYPTAAYYQNFIELITESKSGLEYMQWFDQKTLGTYLVAQWITNHVEPSERVYIHGSEPMVYALADRSPVGRYLVHFHVASVGSYDEVLESLTSHPPEFVLDYMQSEDTFPALYLLLGEVYEPYFEIDRVKIYQYQGSPMLQ
jgi:hypothetical protein